MTVYADTSFFVSIYIADSHSAAAEFLLISNPQVWFTPLHFAEWTHAVAQQDFLKKISAAEAQRVFENLDDDRTAALWRETQIPETAFDLCADLARRHGPKLGVRTLDTLHVACALELKAEQFWTFDDRQAKLAKAEGLKIT